MICVLKKIHCQLKGNITIRFFLIYCSPHS